MWPGAAMTETCRPPLGRGGGSAWRGGVGRGGQRQPRSLFGEPRRWRWGWRGQWRRLEWQLWLPRLMTRRQGAVGQHLRQRVGRPQQRRRVGRSDDRGCSARRRARDLVARSRARRRDSASLGDATASRGAPSGHFARAAGSGCPGWARSQVAPASERTRASRFRSLRVAVGGGVMMNGQSTATSQTGTTQAARTCSAERQTTTTSQTNENPTLP